MCIRDRFIGGMESPVISKFDYGFRAGVKAANPDAEVMVQYANSFTAVSYTHLYIPIL